MDNIKEKALHWWESLTNEQKEDFIMKRHAALRSNATFTSDSIVSIYKAINKIR